MQKNRGRLLLRPGGTGHKSYVKKKETPTNSTGREVDKENVPRNRDQEERAQKKGLDEMEKHVQTCGRGETQGLKHSRVLEIEEEGGYKKKDWGP